MSNTKNIAPTTSFLKSIRAEPGEVSIAFGELIDNSYGEERGNADNVYIVINRKKGTSICSFWDDGAGMPELSSILQLGDGMGIGKPGAKDTGLFGVGGVKALIWSSQGVVEYFTIHKGLANSIRINWDDYIEGRKLAWDDIDNTAYPIKQIGNNYFICHPDGLKILPHNLGSIQKGTQFNFTLSRRFSSEKLVTQLADIYQFAFNDPDKPRKLFLNIDGYQHAIHDLVLQDTYTKEFENREILVPYKGETFTVFLTAGIDPKRTAEKSGVDVGFQYRKLFLAKQPCGGYNYATLRASCLLGSDCKNLLNTNKTGFNDSGRYKDFPDALWDVLLTHLKPLLEKIDQQHNTQELDLLMDELAKALSTESQAEAEIRERIRLENTAITAYSKVVLIPAHQGGGGGGGGGSQQNGEIINGEKDTSGTHLGTHTEVSLDKQASPFRLRPQYQVGNLMSGRLRYTQLGNYKGVLSGTVVFNKDNAFVRSFENNPAKKRELFCAMVEGLANHLADEGEYLSKFFPSRIIRKDIEDCKHYSDRAAKILAIFCDRLKVLWHEESTKDTVRKRGRRAKVNGNPPVATAA